MAKLKRDEQRARKQLEKDFALSLKRGAKPRGWGYADKTIFRRWGNWFVYAYASIWKDERRAELQICVKPFDLDDLVSRILGFEGLTGTPLSLLSRGPHCLVVPIFKIDIEDQASDTAGMAERSWVFVEEKLAEIDEMTLDDFIAFSRNDNPSGISQNLVATLILAERLEEAKSLCETALAAKQWGGSARMMKDGRMVGFFEFARGWASGRRPQPG